MTSFVFVIAFLAVFLSFANAFMPFRNAKLLTTRHYMADVEVVFPNKKKVKVSSGSSLKDAANKAGFSPNYGCEEGKCGSCELKMNGKQKIRPCIGKVD